MVHAGISSDGVVRSRKRPGDVLDHDDDKRSKSSTTAHTVDSYLIGWIAALPYERAAAIAMLDERHQDPENFIQHQSDTNAYSWGRIGNHNVVIASLAAGEYGTTAATMTAQAMCFSLPHLRFGLLVGIGAGIARYDRQHDVRLGDVVVSQPKDNSGGVVQYDFVKARPEHFEQIGYLQRPPEVLRKALAKLQAEHEIEDPQLTNIISRTLRRHPKMADNGYCHQGLEADRLFKPEYDHVEGDACDRCSHTHEIVRTLRRSEDPFVHYGIIASGNMLVRSAREREELVDRLPESSLCFEMEAAGLMNQFPCLVIRGISDYTDSHKNDRWQKYAAITAAAFAVELLGNVSRLDVAKAPELTKDLQNIESKIDALEHDWQKTASIIEDWRLFKIRSKMEKWLCPLDPSSTLKKASEIRHKGSGVWFLKSEQFQCWKDGSWPALWLHGFPGCGKTILCSTIIQELCHRKTDWDHGLAYFFFSFRDREMQSVESCFRSIIDQLAEQNIKAAEDLDRLFKSCRDGREQPSIDKLQTTLTKALSRFKNVKLVLDALDESSSTRHLLRWIAQTQSHAVNILATSREEHDINEALRECIPDHAIYPFPQELVDKDIQAYVGFRIRHDPGFRRWENRPDILSEIESELKDRAGGMFRWAVCQLNTLVDCYEPISLRQALKTLPRTLDETYSRAIQKIPPECFAGTMRLLQLIVWTERPLNIAEAIDVLAIQVGENSVFEPDNRMPVWKDITAFCPGLVVLRDRRHDPRNPTSPTVTEIQFAHFSVKEFFLSDRLDLSLQQWLSRDHAATSIIHMLLTYLQSVHRIAPTEVANDKFPLLGYAAIYWSRYAFWADSVGAEAVNSIASFMERSLNFWEKVFDFNHNIEHGKSVPGSSAVYFAALFGLANTLRKLLRQHSDIDGHGRYYGNALQAAAYKGHAEIVTVLLDSQVDANIDGGHYGNALQAAATGGHVPIVDLLLERGADMNLQGGCYGSALQAAATVGHVDIVTRLVQQGANVNLVGGKYGDALRAAAHEGHADIARILLDHRADPVRVRGPPREFLKTVVGKGVFRDESDECEWTDAPEECSSRLSPSFPESTG